MVVSCSSEVDGDSPPGPTPSYPSTATTVTVEPTGQGKIFRLYVDVATAPTAALRMLKHKMSLIMRKPVFRVSNQVRLKPACAATEAS